MSYMHRVIQLSIRKRLCLSYPYSNSEIITCALHELYTITFHRLRRIFSRSKISLYEPRFMSQTAAVMNMNQQHIVRTHGAWSLGNFWRSLSLKFWNESRKFEIIKSNVYTPIDILTPSFPSLHPSLLYFLLYCLLPVSIFPWQTSYFELTTNLAPLMEFFNTTLSQPDRFIYTHIKNMNTVLVRAGAASTSAESL